MILSLVEPNSSLHWCFHPVVVGNSLKLAVIASSRRSTFASNSALLPSDVTDFTMLPAQRFWLETVSLLDVNLEVTNESARCWEEISSSITIILLT